RRKEIQKQFIEYAQSVLAQDPKIDELIDWENREDILAWLDSLENCGTVQSRTRRGMPQDYLLC
ncbi:MAG: hypothetical protein Q7J27_12050, partial [Syntrophales bacterium]|nr:hypothetical protein [Syntrophales bacterium]